MTFCVDICLFPFITFNFSVFIVMQTNQNSMLEDLMKNGFVQILIFIAIYYLIKFDIVYAVIAFITYFVISHLIDNGHVQEEMKRFRDMKVENDAKI